MEKFPVFIAIDQVGEYNNTFPFAIAWSLPDGQIKRTLISPEDDWDPWAWGDLRADITQLFETGATCREVLYELTNDIEDTTLFCFDEDNETTALETIYAALNDEPAFELVYWPAAQFPVDNEKALEVSNWVRDHNELDIERAEDRVKLMLLSFYELSQSNNVL